MKVKDNGLDGDWGKDKKFTSCNCGKSVGHDTAIKKIGICRECLRAMPKGDEKERLLAALAHLEND